MKRDRFDFYAYCSPASGKYYIDGKEYFIGEDFRTAKRYAEYKAAGFDVLLLQHENSYGGEEFSGSACERCMTEAVKAGIDRIIVSDIRLKALCEEPALTGEGGRFKTRGELERYVENCLRPYRDKEGFYGVQLFDEPPYSMLRSYGEVYRALKAVCPGIYIQCNLLPQSEPERLAPGCADVFSAYEKYLNEFLDRSGADSILFDEYPFRRDYILCGYSLRTYQTAAKVCRERGVELRAVFQTFACLHEGRLVHRRVTERDIYWQLNLGLGFGCREFAFFTYFTKPFITLKGGVSTDGVDGCAMINRDGSRSALYFSVQKVIGELKAFAPVALAYSFRAFYLIFEKGKNNKDFMQTEFALTGDEPPFYANISRGAALITESQANGGGNGRLYMIENISNVKEELFGAEPAAAEFMLSCPAVMYLHGKAVKKLSGKERVVMPLPAGEAVFLEMPG